MPKRATMIRATADKGNNDSRVRNCRVYCCADVLPTRVFTQPGSKPEVQRGPRNVRSWGRSGSRFREAGGLLVANSGSLQLGQDLHRPDRAGLRFPRLGAMRPETAGSPAAASGASTRSTLRRPHDGLIEGREGQRIADNTTDELLCSLSREPCI